jgi:AmmeMemoRadiSam system protein B
MDIHTPIPPLRLLPWERVQYQGTVYLIANDPDALNGPEQLLIPEPLGPLLAMLDGEANAATIALRLSLGGVDIGAEDVLGFVQVLSEGCLLEDGHTTAARAAALAVYHAGPHRPPALVPGVYPGSLAELGTRLAGYGRELPPSAPVADGITGIICPHIDYHRGGPVYARLWREAERAAREAEVVVIFGTDHHGGPDRITLTRRDYATPYGPFPTDQATFAAVAEALGEEAFAEELHHRGEHSVELAAVWLHHARGGEPVPLLPVLVGHPLAHMLAGEIAPDSQAGRAVAALRSALAGRRVLAIAAADLAHVGPAFGDPAPFNTIQKAVVQAADEALIAACAEGAAGVLRSAGQIEDRFRVCGLAPIAALLDLIGPSEPETLCYDQCPADEDAGSIVSIAGVLLRPLAGGVGRKE